LWRQAKAEIRAEAAAEDADSPSKTAIRRT
jgi:hypothetical protein